MSEYTLYHGDCLDYFNEIALGSVDAVICDIPSGRTACKWDSVIPFEPMWAGLKRVAKKHAPIVLLGCTQPFTSALVMSNPKMFKYDWVWEKEAGTGHLLANKQPLRYHESICLFSDGQATYNPQKWQGKPNHSRKTTKVVGSRYLGGGPKQIASDVSGMKYPRSVIQFNRGAPMSQAHPTQKPQPLLEYLVRTYTNEGDTVLDFCFGSGTTGAACGNLNRPFIGIEKDLHYFTLGSERIASAYAPLAAMEQAS